MSKHSGKKYIWKDTINIRVFPDELDVYLKDGWHLGMVPRSDAQRTKASQKRKETCLQKYGVECARNNPDIKRKLEETCLQKYGAKSPLGAQSIKQKIKDSCIEKYGVEYQIASQETRNKIHKTNMERYGVELPLQSQEIRGKAQKTIIEKYGVDNVFQLSSVIAKCNTPDSIKKGFETKKRNGTCNTSSYEESYYQMLIGLYGIDNVYRQYGQDKRYPFNCDFYIKSIDTFIELNLFWTHGTHPFIGNDEDIELLNKMRKKADDSPFIQSAIDI